MAVLSDADRALVVRIIQRRVKSSWGGLLKADLRAALNATDQWRSDNVVSFNNALPLPAKTALSAQDKKLLLAFDILMDAGLLDFTPED